jgi:hypothetical protein
MRFRRDGSSAVKFRQSSDAAADGASSSSHAALLGEEEDVAQRSENGFTTQAPCGIWQRRGLSLMSWRRGLRRALPPIPSCPWLEAV